jgi:hypothetical protein
MLIGTLTINGKPEQVQVVRRGTKNVSIRKIGTFMKPVKVSASLISDVYDEKESEKKKTSHEKVLELQEELTQELWQKDKAKYREISKKINNLQNRMHSQEKDPQITKSYNSLEMYPRVRT